MALDEATTALMQQMTESGMPPLHHMDPAQARGLGEMLREMYGPGPQMASVSDTSVPAAEAAGTDVPLRVLVPTAAPRGVVVYYHGGGWVIGSIDESDTLGRQLAARTGCAVVLVDYRLAPEHRYPAAVEDSWAALRWVDAHLADLAGSRVPLVIAGDSAGGNLAAVMARRAHDAGGPAIALQALAYPVTDADVDTASYTDPENQLLLSRDSMIWFWDHYTPDPSVRALPDVSPLRAPDLSGQPPAVVLTAEHDPLRDEGEAYAEKLRVAGVPVRHRRFPGQMHGFFTMVNVLPGAAAGMDFVVEQVDEHVKAADPA